MRFSTFLKATAFCAAITAGGAVRAADLPSVEGPRPPAPVFTTWEFSTTAYLWASGVKGTAATLPPLPAVSLDVSFGDILKNLGGALMGTFEAKHGRVILFNDFMFTMLKPEAARARGPLALTADMKSTSVVGLMAAGYRAVEGPQFTLDLFAGFRAFYMDNELRVRVAAPPFVIGQSFAESKAWVDAVGGVRMRYQFDDRWTASLIGFAGGGASKYQWDVFGGVGYAFNRDWSAFAGYRAFKVDYRDGPFIYNVLQHGPLVGLQYRW